ncbi:hypothetical protein C8C99_1905 [Acidovorax sp. 107]|nr:hypothetical protein C8C99_1905 [Acidovorax sp. 107]
MHRRSSSLLCRGIDSRCFQVLWHTTTSQSCLCPTPDFRSFHMGIALFTLSSVQNPLRSLKQLFANPTRTAKVRQNLSAEPGDLAGANTGALMAMACRSHATSATPPNNSTEPPGQRPLRGNWPFTARPPVRAPEGPAGPTAHRSFLPAHAHGSKRQAFLACLGTDTCAPKAPRVLRRASDTGSGRLVIAGRMADVCAELDRLAASETLRA